MEQAAQIPNTGDNETVTVRNATVEVLSSVFPKLKLKELRKIKKMAKDKEDKLPERLTKALDKSIAHLEKLIKPSKLKKFFKNVFSKLKREDEEDDE